MPTPLAIPAAPVLAPPPPGGPYQAILIDPPWRYNWAHGNGAAAHHYPTMSIAELAALPVGDLAADPCMLFMWVTWPLLLDGGALMDAWGFTYKTLAFLWIKRNPNNIGMFMGTGQYTRRNTEPCLLGVRGAAHTLREDAGVMEFIEAEELDEHGDPLVTISPDLEDMIEAPRRQHSRKPDDQYGKIRQLVGPQIRKVELFARHRACGFDAWGHGVTGDEPLESFVARMRTTSSAPPADADYHWTYDV